MTCFLTLFLTLGVKKIDFFDPTGGSKKIDFFDPRGVQKMTFLTLVGQKLTFSTPGGSKNDFFTRFSLIVHEETHWEG